MSARSRRQPKRGKDRVVQVIEGRWYRHGDHAYEECCHCGLVHSVEYKLERGMLFEKASVDEARTRHARRLKGIKIIKVKRG